MANALTIRTWFATLVCFVALVVVCCGSALAQPAIEAGQAFQLAAGSYQRGQWDDAVASFEAIIQQHGGTSEADVSHFFLGEALMQRQQYHAAYVAWQNYLARLPNHEYSARATFRMGEAAMRMKLLPQSIRLLERFVQDHPADPLTKFAMAYLGEMRLDRNEPQLAQRVFERALSLQPDGQIANECRFGLARSLQLQADHEGALRFFEFIIREPGNVLADDARLQAGIIEFGRERYTQAFARLSPIVVSCESAKTRGEANYWLGRIAIQQENFDDAVEYFARVEPDQVEHDLASAAWYDGAIAAIRADDDQQADTWLQRLIEADADAALTDKARRLQVQIASRANDTARMIQLTKQLAATPANDALRSDALATVGRDAYAKADYAKTIAVFSKLLTRPRRDPRADDQSELLQRATWAYYQALGHLGLEEYRNAESLLKSISVESLAASSLTQSQTLLPLVYVARGTCQFAGKNYSAAIDSFESYLHLADDKPETRQAQLELTLAYAHTDRWTDAKSSFEKWSGDHGDAAAVGETAKLLAAIALGSNKDAQKTQLSHWYDLMARPERSAEVRAAGLSALAWHRLDAGETSAASELFETLIKVFPKHTLAADAGIALAKSHEDQHDYQSAASAYQQVAANFPGTKLGRTAQLRYGYALQKINSRQSLTAAQQVLDQWLSSADERQDEASLVGEALYQLAWICNDLSQTEKRDVLFERISNDYPTSKYWPDATFRVAMGMVGRYEYSEAMPLLVSLIAAEKSPPEIRERGLFLKGQVESKQQNWPAAELTFGSLVDQTTDPTMKSKSEYWLAEANYRQEKYRAASDLLKGLNETRRPALVAIQPWIALRYAQSVAKQQDWHAANEIAKESLAEWPSFAKAYEYEFLIGRGLEDAGELEDAISIYQKVIENERGGTTETAAIAQWRIGEIRFHQERFADAIAAYYRVDSIFGYSRWRSASLLQAGKCQEHLQNWRHAEKLYRQLLSLFPNGELASDARDRLANLQAVAERETEVQHK